LASGTAIERRANEIAHEHRSSKLAALAESGLSGEDITALARGGDALAVSVLREAGVWLGVGLASFVNLFNPEVIAVGGGAAAAGELIFGPARREIHLRARSPSRDLVEMRPATLGERSGILGAAALARDRCGEYVLGA
jgi:glucokinase